MTNYFGVDTASTYQTIADRVHQFVGNTYVSEIIPLQPLA